MATSPNPVAVDFETEAIDGNPNLAPPRPIGVAIYHPGVLDGSAHYLDINENTIAILHQLWNEREMVFHNADFDLSVAEVHLGLPRPPWERIHDTQYLVYLANPYAKTFALKPSAERYLNIPPTQQDKLRSWVLANVRGATDKNFGAFISQAPRELVAEYAQQDVIDTYELFHYLYPKLPTEPYDRERRLAPHLVEATRRGVRVDTVGLEQALDTYSTAFEQADERLRATLQAPLLNCSSGHQLGQRLFELGLLGPNPRRTPGGQISTDMKYLRVNDPDLQNLLKYRSTLKTLLGTFIEGWLKRLDGDRLHPSWNAIRGEGSGTRTGRLSSSNPNFQNIPNPAHVNTPEGLPELPHMRDFILPEEGHIWIKRDFSAQEIRMLAHFEDGKLAAAFRENPDLDPHAMVGAEIYATTAVEYPRKFVKETGFGILYGMGVATLAFRLGITYEEAYALMEAYKDAIPGVRQLQYGTRRRGREDRPIKTWGGRLIHKEPSKIVNGELRDFAYKLLNYLIQGSSADQTKECIIQWHENQPVAGSCFMATVHDEISTSVPIEYEDEGMEYLRDVMDNSCEFSVPMRSEGFSGLTWGQAEEQ